MLKLKRIYDSAGPEDGKRYLVDRIWPRGVSKAKARLDGWLKDLAPSARLRDWFNHKPERWDEFQRRYREELSSIEREEMVRTLRQESRTERVTLLFAAKDVEHNNAVVLKAFLEEG